MAEKLTPAQKLAVENRGGKLLVSAAAGSGKTKVLVDRLLSYLTDPVAPANLDEFLIITYTKAAAAELRAKISDKLTAYISEHPENRHMQQQIQKLYLAKISTVHGFCADILREYAYRLDIPADFRIAEENECTEMMYGVLEQILDEAYTGYQDNLAFRCFVDSQGLGRDDRQVPEIILQIYSSALCHPDPEKWLDWCLESSSADNVNDVSQTPWGEYLIHDLKKFLAQQILSFEKCIQRAELTPGMEKPALLLRSTVSDLKSLQECQEWDAIVGHHKVSFGTLTFKKDLKDTPLAEQIKAIRKNCKEVLAKKLLSFSTDSQTVRKQMEENALACEGLVNLTKAFRTQYDKRKRLRRVLDFSDMEQKMLDLLLGKSRSGITAVAEEISGRFREIMVDEYQDSNEVQDAIFGALTQKRQNCFMVGDIKQSIYRFRLADPEIFLEKYKVYTPAENALGNEGRKVMLSSNFRSSGGVISAVNDVFTQCMSESVGGLVYGSDEMLYEGIGHIPLPEPEVELYGVEVKEDTYREEACFVASRIRELLDGNHYVRQGETLRPIQPDDIVILLRSPGSVGGEFRFALEEIGIGCTMGNDLDILHTPQVDTLRAILQVIQNPLQDIPLIAALSSPVFGFTANDLAEIRGNNRHVPFYTAIKRANTQICEDFMSCLTQLRQDARFRSVTGLIHDIFIRTNMLSIYGAMEDGENNIRNLQAFCQIASEYEATGRRELSGFLEYLNTLDERGISVAEGTPAGMIRIMSIHKSKGLEFPVVFLCGLSRGFNMSDIQKTVLCHKDLGLGLACVNPQQRVRFPSLQKRAISARILAESISEELRVLYVAMTRARDRLIMTYAAAKLADRLRDIVLRMDLSENISLCENVSCPGSWILYTALKRTEAGAFFAIGGYPDHISVQDIPWSIHVVQGQIPERDVQSELIAEQTLSDVVLDKMKNGLSFRYAHTASSTIPSKLTATQLKGRTKDLEVAEFADNSASYHYNFRKPRQETELAYGTQYGNVLHTLMQYVRFDACTDAQLLSKEICRLTDCGVLTQEQAEAVDTGSILRLFASPLGKQILNSREVLREFKFSILEDASAYSPEIQDDQVLLQGVVDCALIEEDGIVIIDFKTDNVDKKSMHARAAQYIPQVSAYARAMERIFQLPVKMTYLYFFRVGEAVTI